LTSKNDEIFEIKSNGWDLVTQWFFLQLELNHFSIDHT
jgi:hypothetical protein